jgi:hypothetical protein
VNNQNGWGWNQAGNFRTNLTFLPTSIVEEEDYRRDLGREQAKPVGRNLCHYVLVKFS